MFLISLSDLDEVSGKISLVIGFVLVWTDERLQWNPAEYGGVDHIILPKTKIWVPELFLVNPADDILPIGNKHMKLTVAANGLVSWVTGGGTATACSLDMTTFPFDQQTCDVRIMPWGYLTDHVTFKLVTKEADQSRYTDNGEWKLISAASEIETYNGFPELKFKITLKRKPLYFILSVILPIVSLCVMNPVVFRLPVETGERVSYSITLSLSFAVFLSMTSDIIPQSSEPMATLIYFLFAAQSFSGFIALSNACILIVYAYPEEKKIHGVLIFIVKTMDKISGICAKKSQKVDPDKGMENTSKNHTGTLDKLDELKITDVNPMNDNFEPLDNVKQQADTITWLRVGHALDVLMYIATNLTSLLGSVAFMVTISK